MPAGVFERVRQTFLDDPVRGHVQTGRQVVDLALDRQIDRKPGRAHAGDQILDSAQARLRRQRGAVVVKSQHAEHPSHLLQRLAAGALDRAERLARGALAVAQHAPRPARLQQHDADRVRDDVVQLARDPRPLLGDRCMGSLVGLALDLIRATLQRALAGTAAAHDAASNERAAEEHDEEAEIGDRDRVAGLDRGGRHGDRDQDGRGAGHATLAVGARRIERDHDSEQERGRLGKLRGRDVRQLDDAEPEDERQQRPPAPPRERTEEREADGERKRPVAELRLSDDFEQEQGAECDHDEHVEPAGDEAPDRHGETVRPRRARCHRPRE